MYSNVTKEKHTIYDKIPTNLWSICNNNVKKKELQSYYN